MNAGPADTRSPHLDLGDLIAEVTGQPVDDRAREHLARCEHCRAEAKRWDLVGAGVRGLAATAPQPAQPARPRHSRLRVLPGPGRRAVLAVGVAAALVLLGAVGYGASNFVHIRFGTAGTGAQPVLTAVNGCTSLEQASGILEQVNGGSLVIRTASGQPVTVTTTASTFLGMSGPLLRDITDGASVTVAGPSSNGTISAFLVTIGNPAHHHPQVPSGMAIATGTVTDASTAGFTVVTSGGARVPVTTSSDTLVNLTNVSPDQFPIGARAFALGHAGPAGALSARAVVVVQQLPQGNLHVNVQVHVKNCSAASIDNAFAFGG
jgi:hypothetical protein